MLPWSCEVGQLLFFFLLLTLLACFPRAVSSAAALPASHARRVSLSSCRGVPQLAQVQRAAKLFSGRLCLVLDACTAPIHSGLLVLGSPIHAGLSVLGFSSSLRARAAHACLNWRQVQDWLSLLPVFAAGGSLA